MVARHCSPRAGQPCENETAEEIDVPTAWHFTHHLSRLASALQSKASPPWPNLGSLPSEKTVLMVARHCSHRARQPCEKKLPNILMFLRRGILPTVVATGIRSSVKGLPDQIKARATLFPSRWAAMRKNCRTNRCSCGMASYPPRRDWHPLCSRRPSHGRILEAAPSEKIPAGVGEGGEHSLNSPKDDNPQVAYARRCSRLAVGWCGQTEGRQSTSRVRAPVQSFGGVRAHHYFRFHQRSWVNDPGLEKTSSWAERRACHYFRFSSASWGQ